MALESHFGSASDSFEAAAAFESAFASSLVGGSTTHTGGYEGAYSDDDAPYDAYDHPFASSAVRAALGQQLGAGAPSASPQLGYGAAESAEGADATAVTDARSQLAVALARLAVVKEQLGEARRSATLARASSEASADAVAAARQEAAWVASRLGAVVDAARADSAAARGEAEAAKAEAAAARAERDASAAQAKAVAAELRVGVAAVGAKLALGAPARSRSRRFPTTSSHPFLLTLVFLSPIVLLTRSLNQRSSCGRFAQRLRRFRMRCTRSARGQRSLSSSWRKR